MRKWRWKTKAERNKGGRKVLTNSGRERWLKPFIDKMSSKFLDRGFECCKTGSVEIIRDEIGLSESRFYIVRRVIRSPIYLFNWFDMTKMLRRINVLDSVRFCACSACSYVGLTRRRSSDSLNMIFINPSYFSRRNCYSLRPIALYAMGDMWLNNDQRMKASRNHLISAIFWQLVYMWQRLNIVSW